MKKLAVIGIISLVGLSVAGSAFAQPTTVAGIVTIINNIAAWTSQIFFIVAIIFIIFAAFQFVTAGGNPEAMRQARQKILYAVVGIIVALLAGVFGDVIANLLGTSAP